MVYPESEEDDKTSITSQNEISSLVDQMAVPSDKDRAMAAIAAELGADGDGTVEIQNPMDLWKDAKAALDQVKQNAAAAASQAEDEEEDFSPTEVLDPSSLNFAMPNAQPAAQQPAPQAPASTGPKLPAPPLPGAPPQPAAPQPPQQPAFQVPAPPPASQSQERVQPAAFAQQYAPDTPPAGRHTSGEWPSPPSPQQVAPPQQAGVPVAQGAPGGGFGAPASQHGFQRSPSGLTSAALFEDSEASHAPPPPQQQPPQQPQSFAPDPNMGGAPEAPAAPAAGAAPVDHPGPWKLKTNFGLTYEFPDTRGLRSWLSSREELDGYTVSADDGGTFHPLSAFPQLDRGASRRMSSPGGGSGMQPASSGLYQNPMQSGQQPLGAPPQQPASYGSGLNQVPPAFGQPQQPQQPQQPRGPKVSNEFRPPSRESKSRGLLWLVFLLLAFVFVFVALDRLEIFKITELISGPKAEQTLPANGGSAPAVVPSDSPDLDPEELAKQQAAEVERFLKDVKRKIDGNKLPAALEVLGTAEQIAPDDIRIHEMKAQVFDKLGKPDEAEASRKKIEEIEAAAEPPEDAAEEGAPEEGATEEEAAPDDTE